MTIPPSGVDPRSTLAGSVGADLTIADRGALVGYALADVDRLVGLPAHLVDLGVHATGGMGEVRVARDVRLDRVLALKVSRVPAAGGDREAALTEARLTARLEHPSIVPVHDCGLLPDGRVWFTMRLVRGTDLGRHVRDVHDAALDGSWTPTREGWTLRRLVAVFEQVCQATAYAHAQGVVHRDLKPGNVLVGSFGEVQVVDWGLGRDRPADRHGRSVMGTPGYMPPEQAAGNEALHGPHSDVFSLGATLFAILSGRPPWGRAVDAVLAEPRADFQALPPVPPELASLCDRALAWLPGERCTAADLAAGARAWLDGARRRDEATALVERVLALPDRAAQARAEAEALRERAATMLAPIAPWAPEEEKAAAWAMEDRAAEIEAEATLDELRYVEGLQAALKVDRTYGEAEMRLAQHHRDELVTAEARHDRLAEARAEFLLRSHDRAGRFTAWLKPEGAFTLVTDPPGARVTVERYELHNRRLVPRVVGELGPTPIVEAPLKVGSYRLRVDHPGRPTVLYPVVIRRGEHWDGIPPGGREPLPIDLPGTLEADTCYVPAGWFGAYGDPQAADPLPGRTFWVDAFVVRRFPVTFGEWAGFLEELVARGEDVAGLVPVDGVGPDTVPLFRWRSDGFQPEVSLAGVPFERDWPVAGIDLASARRFAAWSRARPPHAAWRLGHDLEWEKAARGVDGRRFPWGDHHDPSWSCIQASHPGMNRPASIAAFPTDESPYGVRGLAGNARTWCATAYQRRGEPGEHVRPEAPQGIGSPQQNVRGGSWLRPALFARSATRVVHRPDARPPQTGVRLFASWGAPGT